MASEQGSHRQDESVSSQDSEDPLSPGLASTALAYMAEVVRGSMEFEDAVGLTADAFGEDYTRAIFTEILAQWGID